MNNKSAIKLLLVFAVTFSLASLPGSLAHQPFLPSIHLARANVAPLPNWIPAGPSMSTIINTIFSSENTEFLALEAKTLDLTDWPLTSSVAGCLQSGVNCPTGVNAADFSVTAELSGHGYYEIEFNQIQTFWGIPFQFGNNPAGVDIRQGIAYLIDRVTYTNNHCGHGIRCVPLDSPVPTLNGGLPTAINCNWDTITALRPATCTQTVGVSGGTSFNKNTAADDGVTFTWQPKIGSPNFCAAADHFIQAFASISVTVTKNATTCVLNAPAGGWPASVTGNIPDFFIRNDHIPRLTAGESIAGDICGLFTGDTSITTSGCVSNLPGTTKPPLTITEAPIAKAFTSIFTTSKVSLNTGWFMYTAGFGGVFPYDSSLYFGYNSKFVDGLVNLDIPPCSTQAVVSTTPGNYEYTCNSMYDLLSGGSIATPGGLEFAPCQKSQVATVLDPTAGQASPTFANCNGTAAGSGAGSTGCATTLNACTSISAAYQAEDWFGAHAYTVPLYTQLEQDGYLANWQRVLNEQGGGATGIATFFSWLNAWSPNPAVAGTIREGFKQAPSSVNPYSATTVWDFFIIGNVFDSLYAVNPLFNGLQPQNGLDIGTDWMTTNHQIILNPTCTSTSCPLGYAPPAGTVATIRNTLRSDIFWHDGPQVTSYDVRFSYLTLKGSFQGSIILNVIDVTVLDNARFDIHVNSIGPFTTFFVSGLTIVPGHVYSVCGATWSPPVPNSCMSVASSNATPSFDPIKSNALIGSGAWVCKSSTGTIGGGCSSSGTQSPAPGGSINLVAYTAGAAGTANDYFRSSTSLARWIWTGNTGDPGHDFNNFSTVVFCLSQPLLPYLGNTTGCGHWEQGIGAPGGLSPITLTGPQIPMVAFFFELNWVSPVTWASLTGIDSITPVLYAPTAPAAASQTLNPASTASCLTAYPAGGYDC